MMGIIFAIIAGVAMSVQGVFNTRLGEKLGIWQANFLVQLIGLITVFIVLLFVGNFSFFSKIKEVNKLYLTGGIIGVIIIFTVITSISSMGTTYAIATILIAQLLAAAIIDAFGLFGTKVVRFSLNEFLGIAIMLAGIVVFKFLKF